ncbi:glycosyltransferase [Sphingomonas sp. Leaf25]|uniref:glycosyltransferase n=1 Tax=Sphingomonas sp. Leaf25 TaxID=1735692 RepID=UPI0006F516F9|nr:glycosyltransferase [Sphingomonas sp. Leaf25]KQN04300.1 hypothetical protein ASE78_17170 [Sphingomonas sp. Leaf25]
MILVTVGTQLPFDRLIRAVDEVAPRLPMPVFAQIGRGRYQPQHCRFAANVPPVEFDDLLRQASLIVGHAGIGSVLMAQKMGKPLLVMPRRIAFGEHRNDHQLATARALEERPGIYVAFDEEALQQRLLDDTPFSLPTNDSPQRVQLQQALEHYFDHGSLGECAEA